MTRRRAPAAAALAALAVLSAACGAPDRPRATPAPAPPSAATAPSGAGTTTPMAPPVRVSVRVPEGLADEPYDEPRHLTVPAGWSASVYARMSKPRFMAPTPAGDLLVSQPSEGKVLLVRRGADGTGRASDYLRDLNRPHDIVFAEIGGRTWVYVAETDRVVRYPYDRTSDRPGAGEVVVDGLPDASTPELHGSYAHALKNIAIHDGRLYVSIASTCNACVSDTRSDPLRGAIYTYDATGRNANRRLFARGLRNAEGLAFVPGTGDLWAVVNNRDNIAVPDDRDVTGDGRSDRGEKVTAYVDDHPPEPFTRVREGGFYGWPFCNPNPDRGLRNMPYDRDYDLNRDGRAADCATATPIDVGIQAHTAPLGLTFTAGTAAPDLGAVIALHGSWNRSRPTGYKVIYFPWNGGPGEQRDLAAGFLDEEAGRAWGRPVDVAIDTDGSLLVSDDEGGALIRLSPPGR